MADDVISEAPRKVAEENIKKKPKKKRRAVAPFLILLFILAGLVSVLAFNAFNVRDRYIYPPLAKIPFVGGFIPNTAGRPEDLGAMQPDQLIARINELESALSKAQNDLTAADAVIADNNTQIENLKVFESQQLKFKQDKADFDQRVAMADPRAFADYYQAISPENAELLYPKAAAEADRAAEIKKYLNNIKAMDEATAAGMLQLLISTDMDLVVSIMRGLDSRVAGGILNEMDTRSSASIIKMMAPYNAAPAAMLIQPTAAAPFQSTTTAPLQIAAAQTVNSLTDVSQLP